MSTKTITQLPNEPSPSLTGYTIYDDGNVTYNMTLQDLKNTIISGFTGGSTTSGTSGTSGISGTSGSSGIEGHLALWKFGANIDTNTNPGSGYFNIDSPSWPTTTTKLAVSDFAFSPTINLSGFFDNVLTGDIIKLMSISNTSVYKILKIVNKELNLNLYLSVFNHI